MEKKSEFIMEYDLKNETEINFEVIKPKTIQKFFYILTMFFSLYFFYIATGNNLIGIIIFLACSISYYITPKIWNNIVQKFIKTNIVHIMNQELEKSNNPEFKPKFADKVKSTLNKLLGLDFQPTKKYFLEAKGKKLDLNKFKSVVLKRSIDLISACLSITFLFLTVYLTFLEELTPQNLNILVIILLVLIFISPIISSFITPIIWTLEDADLRGITLDYEIETIFFKIRTGFLRKFFGSSGIILGFSVILDNLDAFPFGISSNLFLQYVQAALILILAMIMMALPNLLLMMIYIQKYHQINVNLTRNTLKTTIPTGKTLVQKLER